MKIQSNECPYDVDQLLEKCFLDKKGLVGYSVEAIPYDGWMNLDIRKATKVTLTFTDTVEMIEKRRRYNQYLALKKEFEFMDENRK